MISDYIISYRFKRALIATAAAYSGFFTDTSNPFITAGGLIAGFPGFLAFKTFCVNIFTTPEQGTK